MSEVVLVSPRVPSPAMSGACDVVMDVLFEVLSSDDYLAASVEGVADMAGVQQEFVRWVFYLLGHLDVLDVRVYHRTNRRGRLMVASLDALPEELPESSVL